LIGDDSEFVDKMVDSVREKTGKGMPLVVQPEQLKQLMDFLENGDDDSLIGLQLIDPEDLTKGWKIVFMDKGEQQCRTDIGTTLRGEKELVWQAVQIIIVKQDGKFTLEKCSGEGDPKVSETIGRFLNSLVGALNSPSGI